MSQDPRAQTPRCGARSGLRATPRPPHTPCCLATHPAPPPGPARESRDPDPSLHSHVRQVTQAQAPAQSRIRQTAFAVHSRPRVGSFCLYGIGCQATVKFFEPVFHLLVCLSMSITTARERIQATLCPLFICLV